MTDLDLKISEALLTTTVPATASLPIALTGDLIARRVDWDTVRGGVFNVRDYGAVGDGTTDDSAAFAAAYSAAPAGGVIDIPNGTYKVFTGLFIRKAVSLVGHGGAKIVFTDDGLPGAIVSTTLWFQSAMDANSANLPYYGPGGGVTYYRTFTGALTGGEHTFTLASVTGLAVGTHCMLLLGVDPYDATQPFLRMWNRVAGISGSAVTFTLPVPETINGTSHKCVTFDAIVENIRIADLRLAYDGVVAQDQTLWIDKCRNVTVENVVIESGASGVVVEASENVSINNLLAWDINAGGLLSNFGCRDCRASNLKVLDCYGIALGFETQNRGVIIDGIDIGRGPTASAAIYAVNVLGGSTGIQIKNISMNFDVPAFGLNIGEASQVITENVYLYRNVRGFPLRQHRGVIFNGVNGKYYNGEIKRFSLLFALVSGPYTTPAVPSGVWKDCKVFVTDKANLLQMNVVNAGDIVSLLTANALVRPANLALTTLSLSSDYAFNNTESKTIYLEVGAGIASQAYGVIEVEYFPAAGVDDDNTKGRVQVTEALV